METRGRPTVLLSQDLIDAVVSGADTVTEAVRKAREVKLSIQDAREIVKDIETGRGRIAQIMDKKPSLREKMTQGLPPKFDGWRAVAVLDELRSEKTVSLSTDFDVVFNMAMGFPVLMGQGGIKSPAVTLLHYKVTKKRALAFVPVLMKHAQDVLKGRVKTVATRSGDRVSFDVITKTANDEDEVIADVSGLKPKKIVFGQSSDGRIDMEMLKDIRNGKYRNPEQYLKRIQSVLTNWFPYDPMGKTPEEREEALKEYFTGLAKKAKKYKEFLK